MSCLEMSKDDREAMKAPDAVKNIDNYWRTKVLNAVELGGWEASMCKRIDV